MMNTVLWATLGFCLGAIPFSLWLSQLAATTDIREVGDGNPGATNAWLAGGWRIGPLALFLDVFKAVIPVGLAHFVYGVAGWGLVVVALAPALGHAYSPFLRFQGGKALATTFGLWTGLMLFEGPLVLGVALACFYVLLDNDSWAAVLGIITFFIYLLLRQVDVYFLTVGALNVLLLTWKYRAGLPAGLRWRSWLGRVQ